MDPQKQDSRIKKGITIALWLVFLAFFVYSFQDIFNVDAFTSPLRYQHLMRILRALVQPNLLEDDLGWRAAEKMWETFQVAVMATTMGAVLAMPFACLSMRRSSPWGRGFNLLLQPMLSVVQSVHPLVVTIFAVLVVGIGPAAGVLALTLFSTVVFIRNFSEYTLAHPSLRWTALIKVHFPGLALKHLPVNLLIASILGTNGGGGIGSLIEQQIMVLNFRGASAAILACIVVIGGVDLLSRAVWGKIQRDAIQS